MNIQPLGNKVLVRRVSTVDMVGSLYIPENAKEKANVGIVVAVGLGKRMVDLELTSATEDHFYRDTPLVKAGEKVLFGKYSGHDFEHEDETLLFLREDEILAILVDNVSVL